LRDQLKTALSGGTQEAGALSQPTPAELAERIQTLKSSHSIEATPERPRTRNASAAEAITARIRRRTARQPTAETIPEAESAAPTIEPATHPATVFAMPEPVKTVSGYRQAVTKRRQTNEAQLRLF
jgi:hypothetical protein